ncbi:hypothetical protein MJT46_016708 [Ovis ammon polii x Ovis aries]|nr:hypothetical protein MJT46_016708 [Ovis ammon polii x Ovis aries]
MLLVALRGFSWSHCVNRYWRILWNLSYMLDASEFGMAVDKDWQEFFGPYVVESCCHFRLERTDELCVAVRVATGKGVRYAWACAMLGLVTGSSDVKVCLTLGAPCGGGRRHQGPREEVSTVVISAVKEKRESTYRAVCWAR